MNLTLKQIPAQLHRHYRKQAKLNRRSLNSELLHVLEQAAAAPNIADIIAEAERLHQVYKTPEANVEQVMDAIRSARR